MLLMDDKYVRIWKEEVVAGETEGNHDKAHSG
jgi:hypothetical protein